MQHNTLPPLPRILKKREQSVTPKINEWMKKNAPPCSAWEIKVAKGNTVPKKAVLDHQLLALRSIAIGKVVVHKISDESRRRQPFDAFKLSGVPTYVVCYFPKEKTAIAVDSLQWQGASASTQGVFRFTP